MEKLYDFKPSSPLTISHIRIMQQEAPEIAKVHDRRAHVQYSAVSQSSAWEVILLRETCITTLAKFPLLANCHKRGSYTEQKIPQRLVVIIFGT